MSALALVACSSEDEASEPVTPIPTPGPTTPTTTSTVATTTSTTLPAPTTTLDEKAAVLAAYVEYDKAVKLLFRQPDLSSPAFDTLMTGRQRDLIRQRVQERLTRNFRSESPANSVARDRPAVESVTMPTAVVTDCSVDDSFRRNLSDNSIESAGTETFLLRTRLQFEAGRWKVEFVSIERSWEGVAGCAA